MGRADQARPTPEKPSLAGADNSDGTPVPTAIPRASRYWASTRKAEGTRQESDFLRNGTGAASEDGNRGSV